MAGSWNHRYVWAFGFFSLSQQQKVTKPLSLYEMCCTISSIYETSGIRFKRPTVRTDLPSRSYDNISLSFGLSKFPVDINVNRLIFLWMSPMQTPLSIVVPLLNPWSKRKCWVNLTATRSYPLKYRVLHRRRRMGSRRFETRCN